MLAQRIIGALTFKSNVYKEVEYDTNFTAMAWILVAVTAFLNQFGAQAHYGLKNIGSWASMTIFFTIVSIVGFTLSALVISWVAKNIFNAEVTFNEMVRCLGLAYIWNIVGILGVFGGIISVMACLTTPIIIFASILGVVSWFVALKEAVDLDLGLTIVLVVVGWVINLVVWATGGLLVGILGFSAGILGI